MARGKRKRHPTAGPSKEKTKSVGKKETKTMQEILEAKMKEMTKSQFGELEAMPENVLVKIFNYLPNQDIRCGVALVCQKFYKICQDEDLCIYGHPVMSHIQRHKSTTWMKKFEEDKQHCYTLRYLGAVSGIIIKSKSLTSLKIKSLDPETVNDLVSVALRECPKLSNLEIIETPKQSGKYFD